MISIKRPEKLITDFFCKDGEYCAAGWLAVELGVRTADQMEEWKDMSDIPNDIVDALQRNGVTCSWGGVMDLIDRNNGVEDELRVDVFADWCAEYGIEVHA
jgi:hypothetical protein